MKIQNVNSHKGRLPLSAADRPRLDRNRPSADDRAEKPRLVVLNRDFDISLGQRHSLIRPIEVRLR